VSMRSLPASFQFQNKQQKKVALSPLCVKGALSSE
jgi:hypothetical protein